MHIGIVDFAEPTLLLIGEAKSFAWLARQVDSHQEVDFAKVPNLAGQVGVNLRLAPTAQAGCLRRRADVFEWEISVAEAQQVAQQLRELAASASPAHAYLDPESNIAGVQVVALKGEYDPSKLLADTRSLQGAASTRSCAELDECGWNTMATHQVIDSHSPFECASAVRLRLADGTAFEGSIFGFNVVDTAEKASSRGLPLGTVLALVENHLGDTVEAPVNELELI